MSLYRPTPAENFETMVWLGLTPEIPDGLHGPKRGDFVRRHTRPREAGGAVSFAAALSRSYEIDKQHSLMMILKPRRLDDTLWRHAYAVMVKGGPIWRGSLVRTLTLLAHPDQRIAREEATRLWRVWDRMHSRNRWLAQRHAEATV